MANAAVPHDFCHITDFCLKCGAARESVVDFDLPCHEGVTAISHIICRRRYNELLNAVFGKMTNG